MPKTTGEIKEDRFVFDQLTDFLDRNHFNYLVRKYDGDKYVKHFTCWNQLLVLMFGQLSNRESLRDLIVALEAHHEKCYRLGLGKQATRSNLAKANENRNFRIFEDFAYRMIDEARRRRVTDIFKLDGNVYAFDSTTIDLCLSVFEWAKFRTTKGGVKVHTMYDVETQVPAFVHITPAAVHDVKAMDVIPYEPGSFYIFDRGYNDFKRLYRINVLKSFFVIRSKTAIRSGVKRAFIDPSIAVAAMGLTPEALMVQLNTFGFIFEQLCIRDLKAYTLDIETHLSYYHDRYNLEADWVLHLGDGRYALIECKLGSREIEEGAGHLVELKRLIREHNEKEKQVPIREPDLMIVFTGGRMAYTRPDGVKIIPIGCLKD